MNGFNITIYGTSKWRTFESMDINSYHAMNLHIALQHFIDFNDKDVKSFIYRYRALYGCEPNPYSYQAYDVARYFLEELYSKGPKFYKKETVLPKLLQSDLILKSEQIIRYNNTLHACEIQTRLLNQYHSLDFYHSQRHSTDIAKVL
jgi:hypothetical protein